MGSDRNSREAARECREMAQLAGSYRQQETAQFRPKRAYGPGTKRQILTTRTR